MSHYGSIICHVAVFNSDGIEPSTLSLYRKCIMYHLSVPCNRTMYELVTAQCTINVSVYVSRNMSLLLCKVCHPSRQCIMSTHQFICQCILSHISVSYHMSVFHVTC
ncbi:hypothetical protein LSH36_10g04018 [Paralvinella palmiformis]|uniref:Uncharacterized protein n=1 Tax=Paralvinella palmiformis TaxID=53620 RepID=A0AAD9KDZ0_9ANNE|nr:hypothetical protein LSH36_10g04018 [Paralvinella palmiformis]